MPTWLEQIDDGSISRDSWSLEAALESALKEAWGNVIWHESTETVGSVNGENIDRTCKIASQDIDDL